MQKDKPTTPFRRPDWLTKHIFDNLHFYYPRCINQQDGGYFHCFLDDGTICDHHTKHIVGTSRFIIIFSIGARLSGAPWCVDAAKQGLISLQNHFRDQEHGGYFWKLKDHKVSVSKKYAYGHAFALLAAARAFAAGIQHAGIIMDDIYNLLERHFWEEEHGLYADEISADWAAVSPYRGQNANMHLCEAMIAAYEATHNKKYLERAHRLAYSVTVKLASQSGGLIWEHYHTNWKINWTFVETNEDLKQFRPQGFIPGHSIEWSKLLLMLARHQSEPWMLERAIELYNKALKISWDAKYGGIFYSLSPEGDVRNSSKYYWVMAEAIGASALMGITLKDEQYLRNYDGFFAYSWSYLFDKTYGGWFEKLNRQNQKLSNVKSPVTKTDYHPITNCYEAIRSFAKSQRSF